MTLYGAFFLYISVPSVRDVHCICNVCHEELKRRQEGSCLVLQPLVIVVDFCLKHLFHQCVFVSPGPLAVTDAAAEGHGDPGWGTDAEGAAGHRWWHPSCPGAHICWRPGTLSPHTKDGVSHRKERMKKLFATQKWEIMSYGFRQFCFCT